MHDAMIGTAEMDQEPHPAHDSSSYGTNPGWVDVHAYSQPATVPEMGGFGYIPSGLPSDSLSRIASSPATVHSQSQQSQPQSTSPPSSHHQSHHSQLPMLIMPSHAWPSMLTNPVSYPTAPMTAPAVSSAPPAKPLRTTSTSTPRRTLTDDDRRRMCRYAHDNPTAKQSEIGHLFGVERSTVSKVLRHKDKYLNQEDRSASPTRRSKGKLPDIERALAAWARKTEQSGVEVSDGEIWKQAHHFARGVSGSEHLQKLGDSWLEKFKHKHKIGQPKLSRRASETNIPTNAKLSTTSPPLANSQQSSGISPASPIMQPSPLSGTRSDDDLRDGMSGLYSFRTDVFKRGNNPSSTSLSSAFTETAASSFSGSAVSPTGPFAFSPDSNVGGFLSDQRHLPAGPESNFQRPRSQTFPTLDVECLNQQGTNAEPETPKYPVSSTAPSSALESPGRELNTRHFAMDSAISPSPQLHHSNSNGSLAGNSKGSHLAHTTTPISSPASPTLEDARRGLDLALNYVQKSASRYDEKDLMAVIRFFESVGLRQYATAPGSSMHPMSGLSRIPEGGEAEMGNPPGTNVKLESMMA